MTRPRLLDLMCGAGGCSVGYHRAGFDVVGVDNRPQPRYPFEFHQADALTFPLDGFDAIHSSPPCQAYSLAAAGGRRRSPDRPELIDATRARLIAAGVPYVIENVPQAPMPSAVTLCGTQFGLPIIRHRSFETSFPLLVAPCGYTSTARVSHAGYKAYPYGRKSWGPAWREHVLPVVWPWMTLAEAGQAIPPDYCEYIGRELMRALERAA